eukprot:g21456.t1
MGDVPYAPKEDKLLPRQIAELPTSAEFVIHVGDIKQGVTPCDEAVYIKVAGMLARSKVPVFIIPGDNEWNDCVDPAQAWLHWKKHFMRFDRRWRHRLGVFRQLEREENFSFVRGKVLFIGLNLVGGQVQDAAEWKRRHAENLEWTQRNIKQFGAAVGSVVVFGHARPAPIHSDFFDKFAADAIARSMSDLIAEKLEQVHGILNEYEIDAWMIFVRESSHGGDPVMSLVYDGSFTWQSALIVTRGGDRVAVVGKFDDGAVRSTGHWSEVIPYVQSIREPLVDTIRRLDPQTLALDFSVDDYSADGLTHGMFLLLHEYFAGTPYVDRFVSAAEVVGSLIGRKSPTEIERIERAIETAEGIFDSVGGFARPGKTEREVARFMLDAADRLGVNTAWSQPCPIVNTGPHSMVGHGVPSDLKIEPGHILHIDFGVQQEGYCSDLQRCWYVPREGETAPPEAVANAFYAVNRGITRAAELLKPGVEGWQVDAVARETLTEAGFPEYGHALGHHVGRCAHDGAGVLGPKWERYGNTPFQKAEPGNVFTLEPSIENAGGSGCLGIEEMAKPVAKRKLAETETSRAPLSKQQIAERLMDSTCHIVFMRDGKSVGIGTGWVLDAERKLIVTNHHVVDMNGPPSELRLYFPVKQNGEWVVDDSYYVRSVRPSIAHIVSSSKQHDLALLKTSSLPKNVRALPLAAKSAPRGSQLHSVGGKPLGSDSMWPYTNGHVRQVGEARNALGFKTRMIQAQMETNKGNSGGPIVNDYAEIVGVCEGHWDSMAGHRVRNVSLYVDLQALRSYLKAAEPLTNPKNAAEYFTRGRGHFEMQRYNAALKDLSASLRLDSRSAESYALRARVLQKKRDHQTAILDCERAIKLNANLAIAHNTRGQSLRYLKKYDDAIRAYTNAISIDPTDADHYRQRGITMHIAGKTKTGYADFVRSTELAPKNGTLWAERGLIARLIARHAESLTCYNKAVELEPINTAYRNGMGLTLLQLGKPMEAAKSFMTAVLIHEKRTGKGSRLYYFNLGFALRVAKDYKRALTAFSHAIKLDEKDADSYHQRGLVLRELGQHDAASKDFRTAQTLNPNKYKQKTVAKKTSTPATAAAHVGNWVYQRNVNGVTVRIYAVLTANGKYATRTVATAYNGASESENDTGTYSINGTYLTSSSTTGVLTRYYIEMRQGRLWLYDYSSKLWLDFARQN